MPMFEELRARIKAAQTAGGMPLAEALVDLAEVEPVLSHRQLPTKALLEEAAQILDVIDNAELRGRVFLRLAYIKMIAEDFDGAQRLIDRAFDLLRTAQAEERLVEAGALTCRLEIRRKNFDGVPLLAEQLGKQLGDDIRRPSSRRATIALGLALGELSLEREGEEARAIEVFSELLPGITDDEQYVEAYFVCQQALGLAFLARGDAERACQHMREVVLTAKRIDALEDELEARIALAGMLVDRGDLAGRDEARHHLQITRDKALEGHIETMYLAALIGQAGLMAQSNQIQGAMDRCLEVARLAVAQQNVPQYMSAVALMSEVLQQNGDFPAAYRTLAEAELTLVEKFGVRAKELTRPYMFALADTMGREKFVSMIENMGKAKQALEIFDQKEPLS